MSSRCNYMLKASGISSDGFSVHMFLRFTLDVFFTTVSSIYTSSVPLYMVYAIIYIHFYLSNCARESSFRCQRYRKLKYREEFSSIHMKSDSCVKTVDNKSQYPIFQWLWTKQLRLWLVEKTFPLQRPQDIVIIIIVDFIFDFVYCNQTLLIIHTIGYWNRLQHRWMTFVCPFQDAG